MPGFFDCKIGFVVSFKNSFQNLQHPVLPVRRASVFCRGDDFRSGVGDGVAFAGVLKHLDVIQVVRRSSRLRLR